MIKILLQVRAKNNHLRPSTPTSNKYSTERRASAATPNSLVQCPSWRESEADLERTPPYLANQSSITNANKIQQEEMPYQSILTSSISKFHLLTSRHASPLLPIKERRKGAGSRSSSSLNRLSQDTFQRKEAGSLRVYFSRRESSLTLTFLIENFQKSKQPKLMRTSRPTGMTLTTWSLCPAIPEAEESKALQLMSLSGRTEQISWFLQVNLIDLRALPTKGLLIWYTRKARQKSLQTMTLSSKDTQELLWRCWRLKQS